MIVTNNTFQLAVIKPLKRLFGKHWATIPLLLVWGLYLEDQLLQDPLVTAYSLLFLLVYIGSRYVQYERARGDVGWASKGYMLLLLGVGAVVMLGVADAPVFAQATAGSTGANCGGGLFGPLANFFATAFQTAQSNNNGGSTGGANAAQQICTLFGIMQAALVVLFVLAIGIAVYQVGQGAEFKAAFLPIALALIVVVAAGVIIQLFMGNATAGSGGG